MVNVRGIAILKHEEEAIKRAHAEVLKAETAEHRHLAELQRLEHVLNAYENLVRAAEINIARGQMQQAEWAIIQIKKYDAELNIYLHHLNYDTKQEVTKESVIASVIVDIMKMGTAVMNNAGVRPGISKETYPKGMRYAIIDREHLRAIELART